jgi:uncharacterized protein YneF (UPF0154 family)
MSIVVAIFFIGCLTILAFIALALFVAFKPEKENKTWIAPENKDRVRIYRMYRGKAL